MNAKLALWKGNQLAFAGRVTLAKSVIEAIPTYPMMTTVIPKSCIDEIHKIHWRLIWGDNSSSRKHHAINWDIVTSLKSDGGLGLHKLNIMNKACIYKHGWKLKNSNGGIWCDVVWGKYDRNNDRRNISIRPSYSSL